MEQKINFAAAEIIKFLGDLDMTPKESLESILKAMHFIIERGFQQTEEKTAQIITKAIGQMTLTSVTSKN